MSATPLRMISTGLFFILIFFFGFWLSRSGKPYSFLIFTIHKLVALGAVVFLAITVYKAHQITPLGPAQIIAIGLTALCFVITIVTGGLQSIDKEMPVTVLRFHQITPYLTLLSTAAALYLLFAQSSEIINV